MSDKKGPNVFVEKEATMVGTHSTLPRELEAEYPRGESMRNLRLEHENPEYHVG